MPFVSLDMRPISIDGNTCFIFGFLSTSLQIQFPRTFTQIKRIEIVGILWNSTAQQTTLLKTMLQIWHFRCILHNNNNKLWRSWENEREIELGSMLASIPSSEISNKQFYNLVKCTSNVVLLSLPPFLLPRKNASQI